MVSDLQLEHRPVGKHTYITSVSITDSIPIVTSLHQHTDDDVSKGSLPTASNTERHMSMICSDSGNRNEQDAGVIKVTCPWGGARDVDVCVRARGDRTESQAIFGTGHLCHRRFAWPLGQLRPRSRGLPPVSSVPDVIIHLNLTSPQKQTLWL
jgi:hypothetical protein